jgi:hypothetical protein
MDQIRKQVDRARRRLWAELFFGRLVKCWFVALLVATIAVAVPKVMTIENLPAQWSAWWLGGAVALGLVVALAWTMIRGRSEFDAAVEIDRRFDLKERVASSLSLPSEAIETPAGRALVQDAERAIRRLDIDEQFRIRVGRSAWLPLVPALVALVLVGFVDNKAAQSAANPAVAALSPKVLTNTTKQLRKKLTDIAKKPAKKGLKDAQALLLEMDKELQKLEKQTKPVDRRQVMVRFNNLAKQLAERREKLGGTNELKRQLAGMKDLGNGPADKMAEAMKSGNWDQANQELKKLAEKLKTGKLDEASRKQLAEQLKRMEQKLAEAAAQRQQAIEDLQKQIEDQKRSGNLAKAGELQQKLDRMMRQQKQAQQLQQMAQQMAQAQQALEKGDQQAAAESMAQMMQQMQQMQAEMDANSAEAEMLNMAMEQLEASKESMACENCEGAGCSECQGGLNEEMSDRGRFSDFADGAAIGAAGRRAEERTDTGFRNSQVKQNPRQGAAVITGEADGPTIRGDVREAIRQEMEAAEAADADALVIEQMPKTQRENAEDYFNRFREGE